ncbi:MAG: hypothetical protein BMS9Abin37_1760 [Acidobacteriota bacterium]|nr:MAG: hypothetical protein BMS9Abin37_1760 [Acidobacteriota bacterium]
MVTATFYPQSGEWTTLAGALRAHTVAELSLLAEVAGVPSLGRKDDRIAELCHILEGERLRFLFGRLTQSQRAAVSIATHAVEGRLSREGFRIRYGEEPDFGVESRLWSGLEKPSLLCLFIHGECIPKDLLFRLRGLVPPPLEVSVRTLEAPPEHVEISSPGPALVPALGKDIRHRMEVHAVERSEDALSELEEVLRLVEAGALSVTPKKRHPSQASVKAVKRALVGGADFPDRLSRSPMRDRGGAVDTGPIRAFAWPRLLVAGGLARLRGKTLVLTGAGGETLCAPTAEALRCLWRAWLETNDADELHRISGVHGATSKDAELTEPARRRRLIAAALADCPVGRWVATDAFLDHLRVSGRDFEVTRTAKALTIDTYSLGRHRRLDAWGDAERWMILQARIVLCLLFEYAATLGLIDVAYSSPLHVRSAFHDQPSLSRYDGLQAFRLTELGAYSLGQSQRAPELALASKGRLVLKDNLEIHTTGPLFAADVNVLKEVAEPLRDDVWSFSLTRVLEMLANGGSLTSVRERLTRDREAPLPPPVESFLRDCARRSKSLKRVGAGRLLECRDKETADAVASDPRTSQYCLRAGDKLLVVPLALEAKFNRALRAAGFGSIGPSSISCS